MIHIFHHNDPDGWCSAAIALKALAGEGVPPELHECRYGMEFPWHDIMPHDTVYMLDFSLAPEDMMRLARQCGKLHWIDHHVSALDAVWKRYAELPPETIAGLQTVGKGACELTWHYLFLDSAMPRAVKLISMYDVWKLKEEPDALPFQYGIKTVKDISDPRNPVWGRLLADSSDSNPEMRRLLAVGRPIQSYQDECNAQICKRAAFETELRVQFIGVVSPNEDGPPDVDPWVVYKAIACTSPMCNSMLFDSVWDPAKHDIMLSFYWDARGYWTVSVYTTKEGVDCSAIAKAFNGGGHRQASGFQCRELPFKLGGA